MTAHHLVFVPAASDCLFSKGEATGEYVPLFRTTEGTAIADRYPTDPFDTRIHLDPSFPGLKPGSFVGNTGGLVLVHEDVAAAFASDLTLGEYETLPFTLIDHKGRDLRRDYVLFSPLGTADVLDPERSEFRLHHDGEIAEVTKVVMSAAKLASAPDIFRLQEDPYEVFFSGRALEPLQKSGFTNFAFADVEVS